MHPETPLAFPRLKGLRTHEGRTVIYEANYEASGMTLRDYFAAKALQGLTADGTTGGTFAEYASDAYRYADAMLAAREKRT